MAIPKLNTVQSATLRTIVGCEVSNIGHVGGALSAKLEPLSFFFLSKQCGGENSVLGKQIWWLLWDQFYWKKSEVGKPLAGAM